VRGRLFARAGLLSVFRAVPHSGQNLAVGRACWPQLGQIRTNGAPHSSQNLAPSGFSHPQLAQRMLPLYSFGRCGARKTPESVSRDRTGGRVVGARYQAHGRKRQPNPAAVGVRPTLAVRLTSTALGRFARWGSSRVSMLKRSEGALYRVGSVRVRPHSPYSRYTQRNQAHFPLRPAPPRADPPCRGGVGRAVSNDCPYPIRRHGRVITGTRGANESVLRAVEVILCSVRHLYLGADG
jgi:hypothetical protein